VSEPVSEATTEDLALIAELFPEGAAKPIVMTPSEVADMEAAIRDLVTPPSTAG
jgi:hypothetical protein